MKQIKILIGMKLKNFIFNVLIISLSSCSKDIITSEVKNILIVPTDYKSINEAILSSKNLDTILILPGIYNEEIIINKNITITSNFIFSKSISDIKETIIDGSGNLNHGIEISENTYNTSVIGLSIQNFNDGIYPFAPSKITNNIITKNRDGIDYEENSGGILNENFIFENIDDGVDIDFGVTLDITNNFIFNNLDDGIEIRLQENKVLNKINITNNVIDDNKEDGIQLISYNLDTNRNIEIKENIIIKNSMAGIGIMGDENTIEDYQAYPLKEKLIIVNNTISDNEIGVSGGGGKTYVVNNIISNNEINQIYTSSLYFINTNIIFGNYDKEYNNNIYTDPYLNYDYSLNYISPGINIGINLFELNNGEIYYIEVKNSCDNFIDLGYLQFPCDN